jgi:HK97 family phage portal protein
MFGIKIVSEKEYNGLKTEVKGYYDNVNEMNEYLRAIDSHLKGKKLAPMSPMGREQIRDAYRTSAAVMGVVNYIAENVGEVARYLELQDAKGEYIENHWVLDLLRHPNDRFNLRRFATAWAVNKLLFGDAWIYAPSAVGKNLGKVSEMYIIPSWRIETNSDGSLQPLKSISIGATVKNNISMEDVMESFDYNLDDASFFGTSRIISAAVYLDVIEKGMRRESQSLDNGGVANLITPKGDEAGVLPQHQDDLETRFNAKKNVNRTLALRIPVEVHQLGNAPVDLSILETHKEAVTALCFVYKVPVDLYYGQAKYENAKEAKKTIYEQNAIPLANELAEDLITFLSKKDKSLAGCRLTVNTDRIDVLKDKASDVLNNLNLAYATLNERREAIGYEPIGEDYANKPIIPMGMQFGEGMEYDIDETL